MPVMKRIVIITKEASQYRSLFFYTLSSFLLKVISKAFFSSSAAF